MPVSIGTDNWLRRGGGWDANGFWFKSDRNLASFALLGIAHSLTTLLAARIRDGLTSGNVSGSVTIMPGPILRLSSLLMVRDGVQTGVGAALLPLSLVRVTSTAAV